MTTIALNSHQAWDSDDDRFLRNNYDKMTADEIAKKLKRTEAAVWARADMLGISNPLREWTDEDVESLKAYVDEGLSYKEIGEKLNRSMTAVQQKAQKLGIARYRAFTQDELDFLRAYYLDLTTPELAAELERTENAISARLHILKLRRPRHEWTTEEDIKLVSMLDTHSLEEIAYELDTFLGDVKKRVSTQYIQKLKNVDSTEEEDNYVMEAYEAGFSVQEIAADLDRTENETRLIMGKLKIKKPKTRTWTDEELSVLRGYLGLIKVSEIASMINRHPIEVRMRASVGGMTSWSHEETRFVIENGASLSTDELAGELVRTSQEVEDHITALQEEGRIKI